MIDYQCTTCNFVFPSIAGARGKECPNCEIDATGGGAIPCSMLPDINRDLPVLSKEDAWRSLGVDVDNKEFMDQATKIVERIMFEKGTSINKFI